MFDRWEYTITKGTAEADAVRVQCHVTKGFLRTLTVYFPPGCQALVRTRVAVGERPIAPRSVKNYIAADGLAVQLLYLNEPMWDDIPVLNWDIWNIDTVNDHTIWMAAEWLSEEKPYEMQLVHQMAEFIDTIKDLIGV